MQQRLKTLRAAARDGRLPVTYDNKTTFRRPGPARLPPLPVYGDSGLLWSELSEHSRALRLWAQLSFRTLRVRPVDQGGRPGPGSLVMGMCHVFPQQVSAVAAPKLG